MDGGRRLSLCCMSMLAAAALLWVCRAKGEDPPPAFALNAWPRSPAPQEKPETPPGADEQTKSENATTKDEKEVEKDAVPHTLPEALRDYWRLLHTQPCWACREWRGNGLKNGKESSGGEAKEKKATAANGEKDKKADEKNPADKDKEEKQDNKEDEEPKDTWYSVHGQGTVVSQGNWKFHSPYIGRNSFLPILNYRTSETATLFLGARVCEGAEIYFNPEVAGGRGLSNVLGIAGFPNGEITRVSGTAPEPTPYIARLYLQETIGLGGEQEKVEDGPNQIAGTRDISRITIRVGKMAATDIIDDNTYSHDPRTQFLDWAIMYNGAWDYPANTRGYDYGATIELNQKTWALRYGVFGEPSTANGPNIDPHFLKANGHVLELEERYTCDDVPGKLRLMTYLNNAHMGNYRVALRDMPIDPNITETERYRVRYGFGLNVEQEITKDLGVFGRLGWNDGHTETWSFTEIDGTAAVGMLLKGTCWHRKQDQLGLAFVVNDISTGHRAYLAAGGLGFIIGDGKLSYGTEDIVEAYYNWELRKGINVTFDFQGVNDPAYNRDRGPVAIAGIRVHFEY
jgi:high affinity Mn2+ porin